ncbi:MAG: MFS transporter [Anaerolineales bacterium]|nr:MFS transporter [Anaerolineales bacterium]
MRNYRILFVTNSLSFGTGGIIIPLLSLYLQGLGADLALISIILTSSAIVALAGSYLWGWLADRLGRRKPLYIAGLIGGTVGFLLLSQSSSVGVAWSARLIDGISTAAVATLGLTLLGDTLDSSGNRGRSVGFMRGLAPSSGRSGALAGGWIADAFSIQAAFLLCSGLLPSPLWWQWGYRMSKWWSGPSICRARRRNRRPDCRCCSLPAWCFGVQPTWRRARCGRTIWDRSATVMQRSAASFHWRPSLRCPPWWFSVQCPMWSAAPSCWLPAVLPLRWFSSHTSLLCRAFPP